MAVSELAYVLITPRSLAKCRAGGILARLISRTGLQPAGAQVLRLTEELASDFERVVTQDPSLPAAVREALESYVGVGLRQAGLEDPRVMMLLMEGEDAVARVNEVVGPIQPRRTSGPTIRDTFAEWSTDDVDHVRIMDPAVLVAADAAHAGAGLAAWVRHSRKQPPAIAEPPAGAERTLVLIKPDNFRYPSLRPGLIMEMLSQSGLHLVAAKVHHMSVAEGERFYGPVQEVLLEKFGDAAVAEAQFEEIICFMTGSRPSATPDDARDEPGTERILALVYEGPAAIATIRGLLGATDSAKAAPGTVRKEFGTDIRENAAHASDSPANALREMKIVAIDEPGIAERILRYYPDA